MLNELLRPVFDKACAEFRDNLESLTYQGALDMGCELSSEDSFERGKQGFLQKFDRVVASNKLYAGWCFDVVSPKKVDFWLGTPIETLADRVSHNWDESLGDALSEFSLSSLYSPESFSLGCRVYNEIMVSFRRFLLTYVRHRNLLLKDPVGFAEWVSQFSIEACYRLMRMAGIPPSYEALQDLAQEKFSSVREKIPPLVLSRGVCDEMFYVLTSLFRRKDRPNREHLS